MLDVAEDNDDKMLIDVRVGGGGALTAPRNELEVLLTRRSRGVWERSRGSTGHEKRDYKVST